MNGARRNGWSRDEKLQLSGRGTPYDDVEATDLDCNARPPGYRGGGDRRRVPPLDAPLLRPVDALRRGAPPQDTLRHRRPGVGGGADPRILDVPEDAGGTAQEPPRAEQGGSSHPHVAKLPSVLRRHDPVQWLADELILTFVGELLYIELEGDDPQEVVRLVNAVTDSYLEEVVNADTNRRRQRLAQLKEILSGLTEKISSHKRNLEVLAERAGFNDRQTVEYKNQRARERAGHAEQDLRALRNQLRDARIELATLQAPPRAQPQPKVETTDDATGKITLGVEAQERRIATARAGGGELGRRGEEARGGVAVAQPDRAETGVARGRNSVHREERRSHRPRDREPGG